MPENQQGSIFDGTLARVVEIGEQLRSEIQVFKNPPPHLVLFDGALLLLLHTLDLFNSFSGEERNDCEQLAVILRVCDSMCRDALDLAQETPDIWTRGFPELALVLQDYSYTILSFFSTKKT